MKCDQFGPSPGIRRESVDDLEDAHWFGHAVDMNFSAAVSRGRVFNFAVVTCRAMFYTKVAMRKRCAILTSFDPYVLKGESRPILGRCSTRSRGYGCTVDIYHTQFLPEGADVTLPLPLSQPFLKQLSHVGRAFYRVDHLYDFVMPMRSSVSPTLLHGSQHYDFSFDPCTVCRSKS